MLNNIKGNFEEIKNGNKMVLKVLYLPCNRSQFEMACIIAKHSKHESYIFIENMEQHIAYLSDSLKEDKVKLFNNLQSLVSFFKDIDKIVVFIGSIQLFLPDYYNQILSAALKLKKPIYEMPHGLFQSGYNLTDSSKIIDNMSYYYGFGENFPSISTKKIWWYGPGGVGYPRTIYKYNYKERILPEFNLITSNTNWYLYSLFDKRLFFKLVFDYAITKPEEIFIWSPHPAELNDNTYSAMISKFRPKNVLLYGLHNDIYFHNIEGSNDLIPYCKMAISTVSTCLLDYEIHKKKVNLYFNEGTKSIVKKISSVSTFNKIEDILPSPLEISTGLLKEYSPDLFDKIIEETINIEGFVQSDYIGKFIP
ncbi:hypothetical protein EH228_15440 [Erwinia endophytica]|uniref:hypothetical protein n=1 Tax=Erwinia endophytica TaxID=1563158 RepID=UPI001265DC6B|nr:hypothetical protein [Erwinia endophytica]KAB8307384.1 hypothetical protein EH228_15440 [Erwinia endophytica]